MFHATIDAHLAERVTVAHSFFDKGALGAACRVHDRAAIETTWLDSVRVAKRAWPESHPPRETRSAGGTDAPIACSSCMARAQKLKVFRTPTGFHDAYVAAPSRKAALEAWGSDADLFARGIAELVTDADLAREPLEHPGEVIKRSRGTAEEQLAALPADRPRRTATVMEDVEQDRSSPKRRTKTGRRSTADAPLHAKPGAKPTSRPSREELDAAERALCELVVRHEREEGALIERQRTLEQERKTRVAANQRERRAAERVVETERAAFDQA